MMYNYSFVIWCVCFSYLTVLRRYKQQLLACYLVCYFSHLSLVMMCHRCHMLVLGVLLHLQIFTTLFEFCHKLVRRARYQKTTTTTTTKERKKEAKALLYFTQESKPLHHFLYRQCSFCKGKHERNLWSHQKLKFGCSKDCVTSNWYRKQTKQQKKIWSISGVVILQSKETKTANKQKTLHSKHFLQHQHTRGLQLRHTSTTTKTCVACGNSPDMHVNTRYINSPQNARLQG